MKVVSQDFEDMLFGEINKQVAVTLRRIEENYAVRSEYFNKKNACIYADITSPTLDKWIAQGLKIAKINGSYCIKKSDIDEFIENHEIQKSERGV